MHTKLVRTKRTQQQAFDNATQSLDFNSRLPDNVFIGHWDSFLFCESDRMFDREFVSILNLLLQLEKASVSCVINISETKVFNIDEAALIFIDEEVTGNEYMQSLQAGGPANGWFYMVDRYACSSNIGEWCIYCEKDNDVAVIGLRKAAGIEKFKEPFRYLHASPITDLISKGSSSLYPFSHLIPAWREGLLKNYGIAGGSDGGLQND